MISGEYWTGAVQKRLDRWNEKTELRKISKIDLMEMWDNSIDTLIEEHDKHINQLEDIHREEVDGYLAHIDVLKTELDNLGKQLRHPWANLVEYYNTKLAWRRYAKLKKKS
jgi:hypothetical protein